MKMLHSTHLLLCCLFAPVLIFASVAGVSAGLRNRTESGLVATHSGLQPAVLVRVEKTPPAEMRDLPFRLLIFLTASGVALTAMAGSVIAFQQWRNRWWPASALFCGACLPVAMHFLRAG